jgi:hypothetical protein
VSIFIAVANLKPVTYKSVVHYDESINMLADVPKNTTTGPSDSNSLPLTNLLKYEKTIMISTVVLIIIYLILFYGTKRSKGW